MSDKLYELMDWPEIEAVVYSEEYAPREILGPHVTGDGVLLFSGGGQSNGENDKRRQRVSDE